MQRSCLGVADEPETIAELKGEEVTNGHLTLVWLAAGHRRDHARQTSVGDLLVGHTAWLCESFYARLDVTFP